MPRRERWFFTREGEELVIILREHPDPTVEPEDITVETTDGSEEEEMSFNDARGLILTSLIPTYQADGWHLTQHRPMT